MALTVKERELVHIGASVATGCKPCTDYHFAKLREAGAADAEISRAFDVALGVRDNAREDMARYGLRHLGIAKPVAEPPPAETQARIDVLVAIAAAVAVNCTTNLERCLALAGPLQIDEAEIAAVVDAATFIKGEATYYVAQIVELREKNEELQQLLDELKATQAQLVQAEKVAAQGRLVTSFVHEMNTPIGALTSATDSSTRALEKIVDALSPAVTERKITQQLEAMAQNLNVARAAGERVSRIVSSLQSFARPDEAPFQRVDLHQGLETTLTLLEHELGQRIAVVRDYGELPPVACYPADLNQALMNLLTNAAQAIAREGTITIRTRLEGRTVRIEIHDTGVGMSADQLEDAFEPRLTRRGARVKAGLGLFVSHSIMQRHLGRLELRSAPGQGSTATIVLPADLDQRTAELEAAERTLGGPSATDRCSRLD